ncbi:hypothetical protein V5799_005854 [Amblyomma americanum]|uniref:Uncharacterized protein n=1 Tax=Amblyomma americanum TaxID=6943 RepID=A0AAQ4DY27_AMBAM
MMASGAATPKRDLKVVDINPAQRPNAASTPSPALDLNRRSRSMSKAEEALQLPRPPPPNPTPPDVGQQQPQPVAQEPPKSRRGSIHELGAKPPERRASLKHPPRDDVALPKAAGEGGTPKARGPAVANLQHSQAYVTAPQGPSPQTPVPPRVRTARVLLEKLVERECVRPEHDV